MTKTMQCLFLCSVLAFSGCGVKNTAAPPQHPNAVSTFDSDSYDALVVTKDVIDSTRKDYEAGNFPANIKEGVHTALNKAIAAYDAFDTLYTQYRDLATKGQDTTALQAQITTARANLNNATAALTKSKAGGN